MKSKRILFALLIILLLSSFTGAEVLAADEPVVKAVMFFRHSCSHCSYVKYEVLPDLVDKYGDQLAIMQVDIDKPAGQLLFSGVIQHFEVPPEAAGVPFMVVGEEILVGSGQIPDLFPGIIEEGLANGGIDWPSVAGLAESLEPVYQAGIIGINQRADTSCKLDFNRIPDNFQKDPAANSLAVLILVLLIVTAIFAIISYFRNKPMFSVPKWIVPVLILVGLIVAVYLSVIELTPDAEAFCGPVGHCNEVQRHDCAKLFGVLPIGLIGIAGNFALAAAWVLGLTNDQKVKKLSVYSFWAFALFGVLFSTYLTFLEPFVIGATCLWCLTSAVVMMLLLIVGTSDLSNFRNSLDEIVIEDSIESMAQDQLLEEAEEDQAENNF